MPLFMILVLTSLVSASAGLPGFAYSKRITLNTTSTGAGIPSDVPGYPLAIVLDASNFDFSQAREDGADLRFTDADGKPLPFEIEHFDRAAKQAAAWVKVDVKGNSPDQAILMHWGNGGATPAGDGKAVFDEASGYLGAWHLDQDAGSEAGGFADASWNGVHGTGVLMEKGSLAEGRIGKGTLFSNPKGGASGKIKWIEVAGDKVTDDFGADAHPITVSIWAYANTWGGYYETLFARGDGEYSLQRDYQGRIEVCMSPQTPPHHMCAITGAPPTKVWTHYMILRTNPPYGSNKLAVYVNGKQAATTGSAGAHKKFPFGIANNSQNGRTRGQRGFDGILDEARVMMVAKDEIWAKLEYESQRAGSKLLTFGQATVHIAEPWLKPHGREGRFGSWVDARGREGRRDSPAWRVPTAR